MELKEIRKEKGYTQSALADLVGVSQQQVAKYEAGTSVPSPTVMRKLAEVLDLAPGEIWGMFFETKKAAT